LYGHVVFVARRIGVYRFEGIFEAFHSQPELNKEGPATSVHKLHEVGKKSRVREHLS
jgi:hypothetical protein